MTKQTREPTQRRRTRASMALNLETHQQRQAGHLSGIDRAARCPTGKVRAGVSIRPRLRRGCQQTPAEDIAPGALKWAYCWAMALVLSRGRRH